MHRTLMKQHGVAPPPPPPPPAALPHCAARSCHHLQSACCTSCRTPWVMLSEAKASSCCVSLGLRGTSHLRPHLRGTKKGHQKKVPLLWPLKAAWQRLANLRHQGGVQLWQADVVRTLLQAFGKHPRTHWEHSGIFMSMPMLLVLCVMTTFTGFARRAT